MQKNFKNSPFIILGILFILNIFAWTTAYNLSQPQFLEVVFFDVGQGDATLIKTNEGHYILIDGGPDLKILEKLAKETFFFDRKIDLIILTHFHKDHYFGLKKVIENYDVEKILWNGLLEQSSDFEEWQNLILESGAEIIIASAGQQIKGKNFSIDVLYPLNKLKDEQLKDVNLSSVVLRLIFKDNSFLFMGDAYKSIEKKLIEKQVFCQENFDYFCQVMVLDSDILKIGHHGSKTSTDEDFIKQVSPKIAIISVGKNNRYNHPHKEVLDVLEKYDITILRTDLFGDIKVYSDGENIKIINN